MNINVRMYPNNEPITAHWGKMIRSKRLVPMNSGFEAIQILRKHLGGERGLAICLFLLTRGRGIFE